MIIVPCYFTSCKDITVNGLLDLKGFSKTALRIDRCELKAVSFMKSKLILNFIK